MQGLPKGQLFKKASTWSTSKHRIHLHSTSCLDLLGVFVWILFPTSKPLYKTPPHRGTEVRRRWWTAKGHKERLRSQWEATCRLLQENNQIHQNTTKYVKIPSLLSGVLTTSIDVFGVLSLLGTYDSFLGWLDTGYITAFQAYFWADMVCVCEQIGNVC